MINKLTLTPNTNYDELSKSQKELWCRTNEATLMVSAVARVTLAADNMEGVDQDPAEGRIRIKTNENFTYMDQEMVLKDPSNKTFKLENIESFEALVMNGFTGEFAKMAISNNAEYDDNGDGKIDKGMLISIQGGVAGSFSHKPKIQASTQVFFNNDTQSITILEEVPDTMMY